MTTSAVRRLLQLLNGDDEAARQMEDIQRNIVRACGNDSRCADVELGRWIERIPGSELAHCLLALAGGSIRILQVRRCESCKRWMYARRKDQRACSAVCRHKQYEQKPETKERRNAYMRWYYAMKDLPAHKHITFEKWQKKRGGK